jgi:sugar phosphate permease
VAIAALAMVATLPGRTQGLGLITEPLLRDLGLDRVSYAQINLWATLIGATACLGFGNLVDRMGSRWVLTALSLVLGLVVLGFARVQTVATAAILITLTRALGQSALSVASLSVTPQWFAGRLPHAMAVYSLLLSVGFMIAFPLVGSFVVHHGWRIAWGVVGGFLVLGMAPLAAILIRRSPEDCGLEREPASASRRPEVTPAHGNLEPRATLGEALHTPAFWVFAAGSTLYGLVASGIGIFNESILKERGFEATAYHHALAVTALTALVGNLVGGWMAGKWPLGRLLAGAMACLSLGLFALPQIESRAGLFGQAILMGLAGGLVTVLFFTVWGRYYGRESVGRIQGAAQALTVLGSAVGPLLLAKVVAFSGTYSPAFIVLGCVVLGTGIAAWFCPVPVASAPLRSARNTGAFPSR